MIKNLILILFCILTSQLINAQCPQLIFSDDFEGSALDGNSWNFMLGDGCDINVNLCNWGNNELQFYTSQNTVVSGGTLKITAKQQSMGGLAYTSSRIRSLNKVDVKFGRIEARIKMPFGQGLLPAFWMLPTDEVYGIWPLSGEIDIVELLGQEPNKIHGTLHYGNEWPNNRSTGGTFTLQNASFADDFHEFAIEWTENKIEWFIDGYLYSTKTPSDLGGLNWPFDQDFHLLLNLAVGGNFPGNPDGTTTFPQTMEVDYVRVYDMVDLPSINGPDKVENKAAGISYKVDNAPNNAVIEWSIPAGAAIVSGAGTTEIVVDFGEDSGAVKAVVSGDCDTRTLNIQVRVQEELSVGLILESFDDPEAQITYTFSTGVYTDDFANPDKAGVNPSDLCAEYIRDSGSQYDVLVYETDAITKANDFSTEKKIISIDLWTDAPIGTDVLLQFEDQSATTPSNYPAGRHSRYQLLTTKKGEWETLVLNFLDRPDDLVSTGSVDELVILFAPNSSTGHTYLYDNIQVLTPLNSAVEDILNVKTLNFTISPNPSHDRIFVESQNKSEISFIKIYDINGKQVFTKGNIASTNFRMNVSDFEAGMYFLEVNSPNSAAEVKKLIVR